MSGTMGMVSTVLVLAADEGPSDFVALENAVVGLLAIAAGVAVLAARVKFPYTVALVLAGLLVSVLGDLVDIDITPDVILFLLVPPLLFEATLHIPWTKLRANLLPVLLLALLGTAAGTLGIGWLTHTLLSLPWAAALAFGALISATDPVAVIAFFKALGAPKRLALLVEGESLFNDAVAVVAFGLALKAVNPDGKAFTIASATEEFLVVSLGGLVVGLALGYLVSSVFLARVDDPLIETSTTLALAYGSFLVAEEFGQIVGRDVHFSGILAVVAAGLMVGNIGLQNTSPSTRLTLEHFWELLTFLVNSMVFLIIGLSIGISLLIENWWAVIVAIVGVLAIRLVVVYGLTTVANRLRPARSVPRPYQHVMFWSGLRGAISLALVLIAANDPNLDREVADTLLVMTYGVVLFTLLIQGTTISTLMRRLGLAGRADNELAQQHHQAHIYMSRAGLTEMNRLGSEGVLFADMADALSKTYQSEIRRQSSDLRRHFGDHPELEVAMLLQARREALVAERTALAEIVRSGMIDPVVANDITIELDNRMAVLDLLEDRWESDPIPTVDREQI